jgi:hypothetical protein
MHGPNLLYCHDHEFRVSAMKRATADKADDRDRRLLRALQPAKLPRH